MATPNNNPLNKIFGAAARPSRIPLRYVSLAAFVLLCFLAFSWMHYADDLGRALGSPAVTDDQSTTPDVVFEPVTDQQSEHPPQDDKGLLGQKVSSDGDNAGSDVNGDDGEAQDKSQGNDGSMDDEADDTVSTHIPTEPPQHTKVPQDSSPSTKLPPESQVDDASITPPKNPDQPPKNNAHIQWGPVTVQTNVHGKVGAEWENRPHKYPLKHFPYSPLDHPEDLLERDTPWLVAVICTPGEYTRRLKIRSSWMEMYRDLPFDGRFVVANPGPGFTGMIRKENATFGDMIVLDDIQEDDFTANSVKTLTLWKWLAEKSPRRYEWVSKVDTDLFLNARGFWNRFLKPRMTNESGVWRSTVERTMIGQLFYSTRYYVVLLQGGMYSLTWDTLEYLADLQDEFHITMNEDVANAQLLLLANSSLTVVNFSGSEKFDFDPADTRGAPCWAPGNTKADSQEHGVYGKDVIAVHDLKSDERWDRVARCFNEDGIRPMPPDPVQDRPERKYAESHYQRIPQEYWEFHDDTWWCNGVWRLGPGAWPNPNDP